MSMRPSDQIIARSRGTEVGAYAYAQAHGSARLPFLSDYIRTVFALCDEPGTPDASIVIAQSAHETNVWRSSWYIVRGNVAGIGITGDKAQDARSETFETGEEAARAQVSHLILYATGTIDAAGLTPADDPRYEAYVQAYGRKPTATTIEGLSGTWATDETYHVGICRHGNAIYPSLREQQKETPVADLVFGKVPYPTVIQSHLPASNPYVQESGAPKDQDVAGVAWHIMVGTWEGTNNWFHQGKAATAYGVSVRSVDGHGGRIYEWIARNNGWYGESSGPAQAPYGDGAKLIGAVGVGSVNRTTKAVEISGNPSTPLDEDARTAIVNITAFFADQRRIPHDQFPIIPGTDRSFVFWHNEITGLAFKSCPGSIVMNETPALIARVAGVLKRYQVQGQVVTPKPPAYAEPDLPDWWEASIEQSYPGDNSHDGKKYYVCRRNYVALKSTRRLSAPDGKAERSGPNVQVDEKLQGERIVDGKWLLTVDGHHVTLSGVSPQVTIKGVD